MSKSWEERRRLRVGEFEYLLDDDDLTAWITAGSSDGGSIYTLPEKVDIDGVTYRITSMDLGAYESEGDANVEELFIPDSYEFFDEFNFCRSPLKVIHIGKGMKWYHHWSFKSASTDVKVMIDPKNPHIKMSRDGHMVLSKDGKVLIYLIHDVEEVFVPDGVKSITACAISCNNNLKRIHLPSSLKAIGIDAMIQNQVLESLVIPDGVTTIGHQALCGNTALKTVDLPSSITEIDCDTFMGDLSLERIILRTPEVMNINYLYADWREDFPLETCHIIVPEHLIPDYRRHPFWGCFKHIDPIKGIEINSDRIIIDEHFSIEFPCSRLSCPWDDITALSSPQCSGYDEVKKHVEDFILARLDEVKRTEKKIPLFSIGPVKVFADDIRQDKLTFSDGANTWLGINTAFDLLLFSTLFFQVDTYGHLL